MLRCPASAAAHQSAAVAFDVEDGGHRISLISIGLREQCADRSAFILGKTSKDGAYGLGSSDLQSSTIRLCFQRSDVAALVTNPRERIQFKLAVLVHRVLHGNAPEYLGPFNRLSDVPSRS